LRIHPTRNSGRVSAITCVREGADFLFTDSITFSLQSEDAASPDLEQGIQKPCPRRLLTYPHPLPSKVSRRREIQKPCSGGLLTYPHPSPRRSREEGKLPKTLFWRATYLPPTPSPLLTKGQMPKSLVVGGKVGGIPDSKHSMGCEDVSGHGFNRAVSACKLTLPCCRRLAGSAGMDEAERTQERFSAASFRRAVKGVS
jgi:hypothetical protein